MDAAALLYERVADRVAGLVAGGTFRPGERLPSVRELSRDLDVSVSTVVEAYRLLESRGLLEARPQSGHYVRAQAEPAAAPEPPVPPPDPTSVDVSDLVMMVLRDAGRPSLAPLGAAVPNFEHLPLARLHRLMGALARRHPATADRYDPPPGLPALRAQIARRAMAAGCPLSPDDVVTTCGAQEALLISLRAICRPGDLVAVESPMYYGVLQAIETLGLRAVEIATSAAEGLRLESLRAALRRRRIRAVVAMPCVNNPLGSSMPEEKKAELVRMLARAEVPLIEDDLYGELHFAPARPKVAKAYDAKGLVLTCSSFSKTLSPGLRVGWVTPGRFRKEILRLKAVTSVSTPMLAQMAIAEFLAQGGYDRHLRGLKRIYQDQTVWMRREVLRAFPPGTRVSTPQGGCLLWVELPGRVDSLELYRRALAAGITITPGPIFSARARFRSCLRLNAAYAGLEIHRAVQTLGRLAAG